MLVDLDEGDVPAELDAGRFRAGQVESVLRHIPIVTVANLASAAVLLWLGWDTGLRPTLQAWALAVAILTLWVYAYWVITRLNRPRSLEADALRTVEFYACLFGAAWAIMPAATFVGASPELRTVVYAVTLGAAGIGTLAIARVPSAAVIFCGIICSALAVTALRIPNNASLVLAVMTLIFMALSIGIVLSMHRAAVGHALGTSKLARQSEIISLLLKEFDREPGDWLWQTDRQGRLIFASDRLAEVTGKPADSLIGQTLRSIAGARPQDTGWPDLADALARQAMIRSVEVATGGNAPGCWQLTARPRYGDAGEFLGYNGVGRDVSNERRSRDELVHAKEEAERLNQAKTRFLSVMSHELKTPLNSIIGFSEIMAEAREGPIGTPAYSDYAEMIHASSLQLRNIIDDVLEISRIENGTVKIVDGDGDAMEVVEVAVNQSTPDAAARNIVIDIGAAPRAHIKGDNVRIQKVLANLIANAVKFSKPGAVVSIAIERNDDAGLAFAVRDTGIGIAPDDMDRIFEPFVQADDTAARHFGGIGLGLAISRKIARLHGGDIVLESEAGVGTTARLTLPPERITWFEA
ncbi:MAG: PAS domain-containing protein [Rhizobiales bacterium]|nr:PAS domain-containing protein [Hyphomicrobiales bacterium]